jgi:hypothetical protein
MWSRLVIVTNNWHMERTKEIFNTVFSLTDGRAPREYELEYVEVAAALEPHVLAARIKREKISLESFVSITKSKLNSIFDLHNWLFLSHGAYSSHRVQGTYAAEPLPADIRQSY